MWERINKLADWHIALVILALAFTIYGSSLTHPFMGDDIHQIVLNPTVHSLSNLPKFFTGSTFYSGANGGSLEGGYFRPLMTTTYAVLYAFFGAHTFAYHLLQLLLCAANAFILYLFFKASFKPILAASFAILFLLHPINSQVILAIPTLQDNLFFFFGILALWMLIRFQSPRALIPVCASLTLAMFSKESGLYFVLLALLYLVIFDRKRLKKFVIFIAAPLLLYTVMRLYAVGLAHNPHIGPIDELSLGSRLLTAPSILLFYLSKFIFPLRLSSAYFWSYPTFSAGHTLLPLLIDLLFIALTVFVGYRIYTKASKTDFFSYLFFAIWFFASILAYLQISPLDFTASESWFYFPMAGLLGMIGIAATSLIRFSRVNLYVLLSASIVVMVLLGVRDFSRAQEWRNQYILAAHDIKGSKQNYIALTILAIQAYGKQDYIQAQKYAQQSVDIYQIGTNSNALGLSQMATGDYTGAKGTFLEGIKHQRLQGLYDNLASITALSYIYPTPGADQQYFKNAISIFPRDANLWYYLAIRAYIDHDSSTAKQAIEKAYNLAPTNAAIATDYAQMSQNKAPTIGFNPSPIVY